ncbi:MAG: hypothetical protein QOK15_1415 [Nocardioidaceae bacterium]|nr:hypothetical protein [Nocardioidaceae bacterium]
MASALLETKLFVPRPRRGVVARGRLNELLRGAEDSALVLVSAPAGFGKTTLVAEWVASVQAEGVQLPAWLCLDSGDNDAGTFWTYVVTALRRLAPEVGVTALELLAAPQLPPIGTVLTTVINDLGGLSREVLLVLDDYHLIEAREVHEGVAFLLDHRPPQLRVLITCRADPPLPLARWRAQGELVEIRAADLRFTAEETAAYLDVMGLDVDGADVAVLEERTEGWIAALKLAALSMQGRADARRFISDFAGDDRYVVDYLVEEVLQRQTPDVQAFLLQTSVLDRLTGPLCDAVSGRGDGSVSLEMLDRANLFLVPLDERRRWYRYHHLFADVLRTRLLHEQPLLVPALHRRASRWYAEHGERSAAIGHALRAGEPDLAADLIAASITEMLSRREERALRDWLEALPEEVVRRRPELHMGLVAVLMAAEEPTGVQERLDNIERDLDDTPPGMVIGEAEREQLRASVELYRGALALLRDDVPETVRRAESATGLAPAHDHVTPASAAALVGLTALAAGDLEHAHRCYTDCMAGLERAGFIADVVGCASTVADIRITQGHLDGALDAYENALRLAAQQRAWSVRGSADMHVGISLILRERGDVAGARQHLVRSQELGEPLGMPQNPYRWHVAMARVRQAEGDLPGAEALLDAAERLYVPDFHPDVHPVAAWRARMWAAQGRIDEALGWAQQRGLSVDDELNYRREFEHVTLARVLLAQHRVAGDAAALDDATRLLEHLLTAADEGARQGTVIEVLVLLALAHQMSGSTTTALASLERALTAAAPQGYVRVFADEGRTMAELLEAQQRHPTLSAYVRRLLDAIAPTPSMASPLVDPLTERELAVLRMLGTELDGPEIARELVVSLNTVRTHTKNIYTKLDVSNRRAAVRKARELKLLR